LDSRWSRPYQASVNLGWSSLVARNLRALVRSGATTPAAQSSKKKAEASSGEAQSRTVSCAMPSRLFGRHSLEYLRQAAGGG